MNALTRTAIRNQRTRTKDFLGVASIVCSTFALLLFFVYAILPPDTPPVVDAAVAFTIITLLTLSIATIALGTTR